MKELSIIITCWNNYKYTAKCLSHVFDHSYPMENLQVIIIDNNSEDKTESFIDFLIKAGYPITYLKQKENMGFVKGNNIGFKAANTPYVMLLNNDAFVDSGCISEMVSIIKSDEKIGAVGALEYFMDGRPSKGNKPFIFFNPKTLLDPELKSLKDLHLTETVRYVDVDIVGSACCVIRKDAVPDGYLFDERFHPAHFDQEDAWLRVKRNGYRIVMPLKASFQHIIAGTTSTNLSYFNKVLNENRQKFLENWLK